jgi:hypothetical protein
MWMKSSYSSYNGNCVEWKKSSLSSYNGSCVEWKKSSWSAENGNCVEVAGCQVRDSKDPDGPVLSFTEKEWDAFIKGVKNNEFNL